MLAAFAGLGGLGLRALGGEWRGGVRAGLFGERGGTPFGWRDLDAHETVLPAAIAYPGLRARSIKRKSKETDTTQRV